MTVRSGTMPTKQTVPQNKVYKISEADTFYPENEVSAHIVKAPLKAMEKDSFATLEEAERISDELFKEYLEAYKELAK